MNSSKIIYRLVMVITAIIFSCSNDDSNATTPVYNNTNELAVDIDSLHLKMSKMTRWDTYFVAGWSGDDITTFYGAGKWDYLNIDKRNQSSMNARASYVWEDSYQLIEDINNILFNSEALEGNDLELKNQLLGEAYFLRGILYHHLIRLFEKVPLQLGLNIDINLPISETRNIYLQIEKDLLQAENLLPIIHPNIEQGAPRPNKGSAKAFLSRLYLDWAGFPIKDNSKYAMAASSAKQVIDNHQSYGFGLMEDLDDLWTIAHRFNKESIYTSVHALDYDGGNSKTGRVGIPTEYGGWGETLAEVKFFETFPDNHRKDATYITDLETVNWVNFPNQKTPLFAKTIGKGDLSRDSHLSDRNDYLMRYAEVLLTFAEASARSGNSSAEAWEALNKIRRRAELLPPDIPNASIDLNSGDLAELSYTERGWELAGEFQRWFDLVRMERVSQFLNESYRNDINSQVTDTNHKDYGQPIIERNEIIGSLETDNYFVPFANFNYKEWYYQ